MNQHSEHFPLTNPKYSTQELSFLNLLADKFPSVQAACSEIINLNSILNLPKGTEHFLSDIHGEYETFSHILRNASGMVRKKIDDAFKHFLSESEKEHLATLIYYPKEKLELITDKKQNTNEWYAMTLRRLIDVSRIAADKYTRSKVRKAMPEDYAYIIDELLNETSSKKEQYFDSIIRSIIDIGRADHFIITICRFIRRLLIDRLHIIGDIYDRGLHADKVMEEIHNHHSVDIQWGNHDIVWMSAAAGTPASIMAVIRLSVRYNNLHTLEDGYGINLLPLATFAMNAYAGDDCSLFEPKNTSKENLELTSVQLKSKMHKAVVVLEMKLIADIIKRHPEMEMENRLVLDKINYDRGTITIEGEEYELNDSNFPTIDPNDPYKLTPDEETLVAKLQNSFLLCDKLERHVKTLFTKGSAYLIYNSNLLFHGCVPLDDDGNFKEMILDGVGYKGKALLDQIDLIARRAYFNRKNPDNYISDFDYMWYLWSGADSPLFGKKKMATFERYFLNDEKLQREESNMYYKLRYDKETCCKILEEFGLDAETSHIVNGHVPVKVAKGESPVKAGGKLFVIDGGMSKPYQKVTGIAGYTLIYDSYNLILAEHTTFKSKESAINDHQDIISTRNMIEHATYRISVGDTNTGGLLREQITNLKRLLEAYSDGIVKTRKA